MTMASTLYTRIVPADRDRGFLMLLSWHTPVVQRTAFQISTMSTADRANQQRVLTECRRFHQVSAHVDVTESSMLKRLARLYPGDAAAL